MIGRLVRLRLVTNSALILGNTVLGSVLGFVFWAIAARRFSPTDVGIGTATLSAIAVVTTLGQLGLGITLIRFLVQLRERQASYFVTSALVVASATAVSGIIFLIGASIWAPQLALFLDGPSRFVVFIAVAVSLSVAQYCDQLFIAKEVAHLLVIRNVVGSLGRIVGIALVGANLGGTAFLITFGVGALVSLVLPFGRWLPKMFGNQRPSIRVGLSLLGAHRAYSMGNFGAQIFVTLPRSAYPLIVIFVLGADASAYFYVGWMIANVLFVVPTSVATAAFARAASSLTSQTFPNVWMVMTWTLLALVPVVAVLILCGPLLLRIFGPEYAEFGAASLSILALSVFPLTINSFAMVRYRINQANDAVLQLAMLTGIGSVLLIGLLGKEYGLVGVGLGWFASQLLGAALVGVRSKRRR